MAAFSKESTQLIGQVRLGYSFYITNTDYKLSLFRHTALSFADVFAKIYTRDFQIIGSTRIIAASTRNSTIWFGQMTKIRSIPFVRPEKYKWWLLSTSQLLSLIQHKFTPRLVDFELLQDLTEANHDRGFRRWIFRDRKESNRLSSLGKRTRG